jgi:HEAT repeat protein
MKAADRVERTLDMKILQLAGASDDPRRVMRALELVDAISDCRRLVIPLLKFAKAPDANTRSKAIKLMARASQNGAWLESILNDRDPRVRSNLIEGLFAQLGSECTPLLKRAVRDPHHRVSTTALLCLARLGDASSREQLEQLTGDERDLHARAAMWALKQLESATPSSTTPHPNA